MSVGLERVWLGLAIALVAGVLAAVLRRSSSSAAVLSGDHATWTMNTGVELGEAAEVWLQTLADMAREQGLPAFHVTSGRRSPEAQASAMLAKVGRGEDLSALYADDEAIEVLMALPREVESWAEQISAWVKSGRYLSSHLRDDALDLRSRDWTAAQLAAVVALVEQLGGEAIVEIDHLHVEDFGAAPSLVA